MTRPALPATLPFVLGGGQPLAGATATSGTESSCPRPFPSDDPFASASAPFTSPTADALVRKATLFSPQAITRQGELERALARVNPEQIKKDLFYLASDALRGRDTPSPGLAQAQSYIQERLAAHGWQPAGAPGSYLYPYELRRLSLDNGQSSLAFSFGNEELTLHHGTDYFYASITQPASRPLMPARFHEVSDVVFLGQGLESDFTSTHVKDKWVVCLDSEECLLRRELAKKFGARGVIVIPKEQDPNDFFYSRQLQSRLNMARDGRLAYHPDSPVDEIVLAPAVARKLLPLVITALSITQPPLPVQGRFTEKSVYWQNHELLGADNVVALLPGKDPERAKEVIIISAHLDHLGERFGEIYNGADDNASGSAGLLALVEAVKELNLDFSVMLHWVSGEEKGLLGSAAWVREPYLPNGLKPVANINLDMIGRNAPHGLSLTPTSAHPKYNDLSQLAGDLATLEDFTEMGSLDRYWSRSDQYSYSQLGIPVLFLSTGSHEDYHRPSDDAEKGDVNKVARVVRLVTRLLQAIA